MAVRAIFISLLLILLSCKNDQQQNAADTANTKDTAIAAQMQPKPKAVEELLPVTDTGQTWFRVKITKNDSLFLDYEGSWPVVFESNNSGTIQLSKSKSIMSVTDILTIYMNGVQAGKMPVLPSNREKGTASMVMSTVTDGVYGIPLLPGEGFLNITKIQNQTVSGNFEAKAIDGNKDSYQFMGYFLNAKINPDKI